MLHVAAGYGAEFIVHYLLELGASVGFKDADGRIPIHEAAHNGSIAVFNDLVAHGSEYAAKDDYRNTPMHLACFAGNFLVVEHLLMLYVDLSEETIDHKTCIQLAYEMKRYPVIEIFELYISSDERYFKFKDLIKPSV